MFENQDPNKNTKPAEKIHVSTFDVDESDIPTQVEKVTEATDKDQDKFPQPKKSKFKRTD